MLGNEVSSFLIDAEMAYFIDIGYETQGRCDLPSVTQMKPDRECLLYTMGVCVSYSSIAVIKHYDQGNSQKKQFVWVTDPGGEKSMMAERRYGGFTS